MCRMDDPPLFRSEMYPLTSFRKPHEKSILEESCGSIMAPAVKEMVALPRFRGRLT